MTDHAPVHRNWVILDYDPGSAYGRDILVLTETNIITGDTYVHIRAMWGSREVASAIINRDFSKDASGIGSYIETVIDEADRFIEQYEAVRRAVRGAIESIRLSDREPTP